MLSGTILQAGIGAVFPFRRPSFRIAGSGQRREVGGRAVRRPRKISPFAFAPREPRFHSRMDMPSTSSAPRWMRRVLLAAGAYNVLWGAFVVIFPEAIFRWVGMA